MKKRRVDISVVGDGVWESVRALFFGNPEKTKSLSPDTMSKEK